MDQNHSAGSDPYETSSPSIPLFTKPVGHLSSSSIVSTIALSLVGAALLIYVVVSKVFIHYLRMIYDTKPYDTLLSVSLPRRL